MDDLEQLKAHQLGLLRHLTTTSLLALGGLLTFLGTILADVTQKGGIMLAAALFLFAAMITLTNQDRLAGEIIRSRSQLEPSRRAARTATFALLAGAGVVTGVMLLVLV
ncbi:MAG: hypothetical protein ACK4TG_11375 [Thermaurantiacus sp.]